MRLSSDRGWSVHPARLASDQNVNMAATKQKTGPKVVTAAHKRAMAVGRAESRTVSTYLDALEARKPRPGRKRTEGSIGARLEAIEAEFDETDMLTRVNLIQERMNLTAELAAMEATGEDLSELEAAFVAVAKSYSERKGITYAAWRETGLAAATLRMAGIGR